MKLLTLSRYQETLVDGSGCIQAANSTAGGEAYIPSRMPILAMFADYIKAAMDKATYEIIGDPESPSIARSRPAGRVDRGKDPRVLQG